MHMPSARHTPISCDVTALPYAPHARTHSKVLYIIIVCMHIAHNTVLCIELMVGGLPSILTGVEW